MSSQPLLRLLRSRMPQIRSFTQTTPFLAGKPSARVPPPPSFQLQPKSSPKPASIQQRASKPQARPSVPAPPPRPAQTHATSSAPQSYASGILGDADSLLLYKAPKNMALFASCFITGGAIFYWVGTVANGVFLNFTVPWYAKGIVLAGCLMSSAMASAIMITPHHLVKSITLVRTAEKTAVLRVKGTRFFPFMKPATFDLAPGQLMVDANVTMTLETARRWYDVPLKNGKAWTEGNVPRPDGLSGNAIQRFNQRLMRISPATFSQVRKMFNRDGMAYVRIGSGNWKMDLEQCEILENGSVLMKMAREGAVRTSLLSMATSFGK